MGQEETSSSGGLTPDKIVRDNFYALNNDIVRVMTGIERHVLPHLIEMATDRELQEILIRETAKMRDWISLTQQGQADDEGIIRGEIKITLQGVGDIFREDALAKDRDIGERAKNQRNIEAFNEHMDALSRAITEKVWNRAADLIMNGANFHGHSNSEAIRRHSLVMVQSLFALQKRKTRVITSDDAMASSDDLISEIMSKLDSVVRDTILSKLGEGYSLVDSIDIAREDESINKQIFEILIDIFDESSRRQINLVLVSQIAGRKPQHSISVILRIIEESGAQPRVEWLPAKEGDDAMTTEEREWMLKAIEIVLAVLLMDDDRYHDTRYDASPNIFLRIENDAITSSELYRAIIKLTGMLAQRFGVFGKIYANYTRTEFAMQFSFDSEHPLSMDASYGDNKKILRDNIEIELRRLQEDLSRHFSPTIKALDHVHSFLMKNKTLRGLTYDPPLDDMIGAVVWEQEDDRVVSSDQLRLIERIFKKALLPIKRRLSVKLVEGALRRKIEVYFKADQSSSSNLADLRNLLLEKVDEMRSAGVIDVLVDRSITDDALLDFLEIVIEQLEPSSAKQRVSDMVAAGQIIDDAVDNERSDVRFNDALISALASFYAERHSLLITDYMRETSPGQSRDILDVLIKLRDGGIIPSESKIREAKESIDQSASDGDAAMTKAQRIGGINLNPELLDLQILRDDMGIPLPVFNQPIENMKIDGFLPVIINITPIPNLPMLLGIADQIPADEPIDVGSDIREEYFEARARIKNKLWDTSHKKERICA